MCIRDSLLPDVLDNALASLAQSAVGWAASLSAALTSGAFRTAASIPHALLGTVLLVMGTYYMTADLARIAAFFHRTFPGGLMTVSYTHLDVYKRQPS